MGGAAAPVGPRPGRGAVHAGPRARPADLGGIAEAFRATGSITRALQRQGVADFERASSTVSCRLPTVAEADALARPATEPVLVVQYVNADTRGQPVEAGCTLFAADAVQLTVTHEDS